MKKIKKFSSLLCLVSLMFSTTPMKAPASPDCWASWALAFAYFYGGAIGFATVCVGGTQCYKATCNGCETLSHKFYKWLEKKDEDISLSPTTPLLKASSKKDVRDNLPPLKKAPSLNTQFDEND